MSQTVVVYSTLTEVIEPKFSCKYLGMRTWEDEDFNEHLYGFANYVYKEAMDSKLYSVICHIMKTNIAYSIEIDSDELNFKELSSWVIDVNGICYLQDTTVRDPYGYIIAGGDDVSVDNEGAVPYPKEAWERKYRTDAFLAQKNIKVMESLSPVVSERELILRHPALVITRALGVDYTAANAWAVLDENNAIIQKIDEKFPDIAECLTVEEESFINLKKSSEPGNNDVLNDSEQLVWRVEALNVLLWYLGIGDELVFPGIDGYSNVLGNALQIFDPSILNLNDDELNNKLNVRSPEQLLDALDLHYRLHWYCREHGENGILSESVIMERHKALNWLVNFEKSGWDYVNTPT